MSTISTITPQLKSSPATAAEAPLVIDEDHCCAVCRHLSVKPFVYLCANLCSPEYGKDVGLPLLWACKHFERHKGRCASLGEG